LFDRATGVSAFALHLAGCEGRPPAPGTVPAGAWGKAIVYAPRRVTVGDSRPWLARGVRDVPAPDSIVEGGPPICTGLAPRASRDACAERLGAETAAVLAECRSAPPSA